MTNEVAIPSPIDTTMMTFGEWLAMREGMWLNDRKAVVGLSNINPLLKKNPKPLATPAPTVKSFKPKKVK